MLHHRAFGRDLETVSLAVIDNRRPMLSLLRAMLAAIGTGPIETYENPADALDAMPQRLPDLVIAAASMQPITGPRLVRSMRRASSGPLALVPAMIMSGRAKPALVEEALRAGAHQMLVLPTTASTLYRRLEWLINDERPFELKGDHYVLSGVEQRLALSVPRPAFVPSAPEFFYAGSAAEPALELEIARKVRVAPN